MRAEAHFEYEGVAACACHCVYYESSAHVVETCGGDRRKPEKVEEAEEA